MLGRSRVAGLPHPDGRQTATGSATQSWIAPPVHTHRWYTVTASRPASDRLVILGPAYAALP